MAVPLGGHRELLLVDCRGANVREGQKSPTFQVAAMGCGSFASHQYSYTSMASGQSHGG